MAKRDGSDAGAGAGGRPRRVSLADRGIPMGADAVYAADGGQSSAAVYQLPTGGPKKGESWEGSHKRVTFYCDTQLLALVDEEVETSRREGNPISKTQIIEAGLIRRYQEQGRIAVPDTDDPD
jgi:hypothetical protein